VRLDLSRQPHLGHQLPVQRLRQHLHQGRLEATTVDQGRSGDAGFEQAHSRSPQDSAKTCR